MWREQQFAKPLISLTHTTLSHTQQLSHTQRSLTHTHTLCSRRGTYGTGLPLLARLGLVAVCVAGVAFGPFCVAGVALGDVDFTLCGRCGNSDPEAVTRRVEKFAVAKLLSAVLFLCASMLAWTG